MSANNNESKGVHRCESITLPCWWHKFDGNLRKWIRGEMLGAVWKGILSWVGSFGALPLGLHLSLALEERGGGMTTKCSPITAVWCAQTAHITCAWWIACIMNSSSNCFVHLTAAAFWTLWCSDQVMKKTPNKPRRRNVINEGFTINLRRKKRSITMYKGSLLQ